MLNTTRSLCNVYRREAIRILHCQEVKIGKQEFDMHTLKEKKSIEIIDSENVIVNNN
ncbi:MAG: hypothetical protein R6V04_05540 [bacterium]